MLHARRRADRAADHPPGHADLRHARARLRVDARRGQGRRRAPVAPGEDHQRAPRRVAQLPAQPRVQHVVHGRHRAGLQARPGGHAGRAKEQTGAESVRQLPTLKLFKIRMDLEMAGDTEALAKAAEAVEPAETERPALRRARQGRRARHAGRPADRLRALRRRPPRAGHAGRRARRAPRGHGRAPAAAPRRRDPLPPPRRLQRQRHGRLAGAPRTASWRPARGWPRSAASRHCYERPTYGDWPYQLFTMAHGRSKEECDAILDADRDRGRLHRAARDALLLDRVQEGPAPVLHRGLQELGTGARGRRDAARRHGVSLTDAKSAELYARALQRLPGGVNSPVRAMRAIGRDPIFIDRAEGAEIVDVDGNRYVDYVCSWGPLIHGHAHPEIVARGRRRPPQRGTTFGAPTAGEVELAEEVARRMPSVEMVRMTSSGTEASMSAIRLARAATGRTKLLKFAGAYHGHVDGLLAQAGSGLATAGHPGQRRRAGVRDARDGHRAVERRRGRRRARSPSTSSPRSSPSPTRPTWASSPPVEGFLELLRNQADDDRRAADLRRGHHRLPRRRRAAPRSARASRPT